MPGQKRRGDRTRRHRTRRNHEVQPVEAREVLPEIPPRHIEPCREPPGREQGNRTGVRLDDRVPRHRQAGVVHVHRRLKLRLKRRRTTCCEGRGNQRH